MNKNRAKKRISVLSGMSTATARPSTVATARCLTLGLMSAPPTLAVRTRPTQQNDAIDFQLNINSAAGR